MQGSCTPPHGQIWSTYQPRSNIPQAITNWSRLPLRALHHRKSAGRTSIKATSWPIALALPVILPEKSGVCQSQLVTVRLASHLRAKQ
jgi:hypothetical protein